MPQSSLSRPSPSGPNPSGLNPSGPNLSGPTCPSVGHVLDRVDGGLARVRRPGGRIDAAGLEAVAEAAERWGNGVVELTNRANLQLRGVRDGAARELGAALVAAGLSGGEGTDRRRNVLVDPMGGLDPGGTDFGSVLAPLLQALDGDGRLDALDDKFGFALDGGGAWNLAGRRAAVVATAGDRSATAVVRCGWRGPGGSPTEVPVADLPAALTEAAAESLGRPRTSVEVPGGPRRLCGPLGAGLAVPPPPAGPAPIGWVGAMPLLGRTDAPTLAGLAAAARRYSGGQVRLTPWRGLVLPGVVPARQAELLGELRRLGLVVDAGDPAAPVVACAGSRGCTSALVDAIGDAQAVIGARRRGGRPVLDVHVSGCPKRCAQSATASVELIATAEGVYDLYLGGRLLAAGLPAGEAVAHAAGLPAGAGGTGEAAARPAVL